MTASSRSGPTRRRLHPTSPWPSSRLGAGRTSTLRSCVRSRPVPQATDVEASSTPAVAYERLRRQFVALVRKLDATDLRPTVPATPAWTVHDVLAHVVGIPADLNASKLGDSDANAWTARQVEERRNSSVEQMTAEWSREAPAFESGLTLFGDDIGKHYVGDLGQHLIDVQAALGLPPSIDREALLFGLDFYLDDLHERLVSADIGAELSIDDRRIVVGAATPVAGLHSSAFEVFRALGGRRSLAQLGHLSWEGDAGQLVRHLSAYPLPEADLVDTGVERD